MIPKSRINIRLNHGCPKILFKSELEEITYILNLKIFILFLVLRLEVIFCVPRMFVIRHQLTLKHLLINHLVEFNQIIQE